jgi:hypothetical protein
MHLRYVHRMLGDNPHAVQRLASPVTFQAPPPLDATVTFEATAEEARVTLNARVDPTRLSATTTPTGHRFLVLPEADLLRALPTAFADLIAFLLDTPVHLVLQELTMNPDSLEDDAVLQRLGAWTFDWGSLGSIHFETRAFLLRDLDEGRVTKLLGKSVGLGIYKEAISTTRSTMRFRELWRVLESAFGCRNDQLVAILSEYAPAMQLGFTKGELEQLLVLRGRISHASTRPSRASHEFESVRAEVDRRLDRLKGLTERVLVTKREWGRKTLGVDELARVHVYRDATGGLVVVKWPQDQ